MSPLAPETLTCAVIALSVALPSPTSGPLLEETLFPLLLLLRPSLLLLALELRATGDMEGECAAVQPRASGESDGRRAAGVVISG